ncbi:MAG: hypothetical protein J5858_03665 [Lentisphaeria bacterium]|nr:hypothetical protein [Lentisphaeria bacterium]
MRKCGVFFCAVWTVLLLFPVFRSEAQIGLRVEMSQLHYLQYEPVYVRVTMRNLSGHSLAFGENEKLRGKLRFEIGAPHSGGFSLLLNQETPPVKGIILQPGTSRSFTYNVGKYYDVRRLGSYTLKAIISHPQLKTAYESNTTQFTVVKGTDIWKTTAGVPKYLLQRLPGAIPTRQYRIVSYNTGRHFLYILLIEDKDRIYLVRRLGLDLGTNLRPQCAVDDLSRLNLLIAASPKVFAYYQYDINGHLEKKEVRIKTTTTPRLVANRDIGTVVLDGGRPARRDMDYEEIKDLPFMAQAMGGGDRDITEGKSIIDEKDDD